jgi:hypothetical protein
MESALAPRFALRARHPLLWQRDKRMNRMPWFVAALLLLLSACSLAPPLKTPDIPTAEAYKELGA